MFYEKLKDRLNQLIEMGEKILSTRHQLGEGIIGTFIDDDLFYHWKAGALSFLDFVSGDDSTHFQLFQKNSTHAMYSEALQGQGVLKAAKEDIEGGYLKKLETLVAADIFTDFLEMAEHLVEQGYKDPAASLIGAVLARLIHKKRPCIN